LIHVFPPRQGLRARVVIFAALAVLAQAEAASAEIESPVPPVGPEVAPPAPLSQAALDSMIAEDIEREGTRKQWRAFGMSMAAHGGFAGVYLLTVGMVCWASAWGGHDDSEMDDNCGVEAVDEMTLGPMILLFGGGSVVAGSIISTAVMNRSQYYSTNFFAVLGGGLIGLGGHIGLTYAAVQSNQNEVAVPVAVATLLLLPAIGEAVGSRIFRRREIRTRAAPMPATIVPAAPEPETAPKPPSEAEEPEAESEVTTEPESETEEPAPEPTPESPAEEEPAPDLEPEVLPPVPIALVTPDGRSTAFGLSFALLF